MVFSDFNSVVSVIDFNSVAFSMAFGFNSEKVVFYAIEFGDFNSEIVVFW